MKTFSVLVATRTQLGYKIQHYSGLIAVVYADGVGPEEDAIPEELIPDSYDTDIGCDRVVRRVLMGPALGRLLLVLCAVVR